MGDRFKASAASFDILLPKKAATSFVGIGALLKLDTLQKKFLLGLYVAYTSNSFNYSLHIMRQRQMGTIC